MEKDITFNQDGLNFSTKFTFEPFGGGGIGGKQKRA